MNKMLFGAAVAAVFAVATAASAATFNQGFEVAKGFNGPGDKLEAFVLTELRKTESGLRDALDASAADAHNRVVADMVAGCVNGYNGPAAAKANFEVTCARLGKVTSGR